MNAFISQVNAYICFSNSGLGFNIRGGTDMQHVKGNNGIFVTKIRDKGAAAEDGQLREGDQIVEVNLRLLLKISCLENFLLLFAYGKVMLLFSKANGLDNVLLF